MFKESGNDKGNAQGNAQGNAKGNAKGNAQGNKEFEEFGDLVKDHVFFNANVALLVKNLVDVGIGAKAGARVATTAASKGAEAVLRSIGIGANVLRIGMFAVSAALLPVDVYTLVKSSMAIDSARKGKKDKEPEAVKNLRDLATGLKKEMKKMLLAVEKFEREQRLLKENRPTLYCNTSILLKAHKITL